MRSSRISDQIRDLLDSQEKLRQLGMMPSLHKAMRDALAGADVSDQIQRSFASMQEQLKSLQLTGITNAFQNVDVEQFISAISSMPVQLQSWQRWMEALDRASFEGEMLQVATDGTATLANEKATSAEIEDAFRDLFDRLSDYLLNIGERVLEHKKPIQALLQWFISNVILPVLIAIYFQQQAGIELREMQRHLELEVVKTRRDILAALKEAQSAWPVVGQENYRVVIGRDVRIRMRPDRSAPVKGHLRLGTIVRFVEKQRRWTAVEYIDPQTEAIESGWVFNKYLERVNWPKNKKK